MLVMDQREVIRDDDCLSSKMNNNNHPPEEGYFQSWHPHVYANPPKQPTPHMISDILGWSGAPLNTPLTGDEPLNLTVRSRSPHMPFREPPTNGIDKPINGRMEFSGKSARRSQGAKGESQN